MLSLCLRFILTLALLFFISFASLVHAYGAGGDGGNGGGGAGGNGGGADGNGGFGLSNSTTKKVTRIIDGGIRRCLRVAKIYRYDCYRQTYKQAVSFLNGRPAYADAQKALIAVEVSLDKITTRYADPQTPAIRKGVQKFHPIKAAAVPKAKVELTKALDQAETALLRTPERTGTHYARIAEAVHSNKVLLRSRLYPDATDPFQTTFA